MESLRGGCQREVSVEFRGTPGLRPELISRSLPLLSVAGAGLGRGYREKRRSTVGGTLGQPPPALNRRDALLAPEAGAVAGLCYLRDLRAPAGTACGWPGPRPLLMEGVRAFLRH